ncbi:hypothetical protein WDU94_010674 [Cyamophila willieti]
MCVVGEIGGEVEKTYYGGVGMVAGKDWCSSSESSKYVCTRGEKKMEVGGVVAWTLANPHTTTMYPATLVLISTLCSIISICQVDASAYNWTVAEEDQVCALAEQNHNFCSSKGAADEQCKTIATKVNGLDPKCHDGKVCTFSKGGVAVYVTCDCIKKGYEILRNCINNVGIANPDAKTDLSNPETSQKVLGMPGKGKYEALNIKPRLLCKPEDTASLTTCGSQALREDFIKNFHAKDQIGNLCGGFCTHITEVNMTSGKQTTVVRCSLIGTYLHPESKQRERFRINLFNHGTDPKVVGISYMGEENLLGSS